MIPTPLPTRDDPQPSAEYVCSIAARWGIRPELAQRLVCVSQRLEFGVSIISGARTRGRQEELERQGRPAAPWHLTTHADTDASGCPRLATGADVRTAVAPVTAVQARFGAEAVHCGLRWGGGSPVNPTTGIPSDWNHVDLGPRSQTG